MFEYAAAERFKTLRADFERLKLCRERFWAALDKDIFIRLSGVTSSPYILSVSALGLRGEILLHMADDKGLIIGTGRLLVECEKPLQPRNPCLRL
ncbi:MAG: hypothetical protein ACLRSW_01420 [Christensenellaceae bacterium]